MKKTSAKKSAVKPDRSDYFRLRLYIAGQTPNSVAAIANLKKIWGLARDVKPQSEIVASVGLDSTLLG
jgi:hypothetical protein